MKKYEREGGKASLNSLDYTEKFAIWGKMSRLYKQKKDKEVGSGGGGEKKMS